MKVLIIGNGIAGMSAAIEAAELEDEVILVSPVQSERTQSVMAPVNELPKKPKSKPIFLLSTFSQVVFGLTTAGALVKMWRPSENI